MVPMRRSIAMREKTQASIIVLSVIKDISLLDKIYQDEAVPELLKKELRKLMDRVKAH